MLHQVQELKQRLFYANHLPDMLLLKASTQSTNDDVLNLVKLHPELKSALICSEQQTKGRGQHQRTWQSPQGNLYLSCLAELNIPINGKLALEVGLNILNCPTFQDFPLKIKWANDLYSHQGKWGGILIEPINSHLAVVGIGINLNPLPQTDLENISQASTSLQQMNIPFQRVKLIAEIYLAVQQATQWFNFGSKNLAQRFAHHAYLLHEVIQFETHQKTIQGIFHGINDDGALLLENISDQSSATKEIHPYYQGRIILPKKT